REAPAYGAAKAGTVAAGFSRSGDGTVHPGGPADAGGGGALASGGGGQPRPLPGPTGGPDRTLGRKKIIFFSYDSCISRTSLDLSNLEEIFFFSLARRMQCAPRDVHFAPPPPRRDGRAGP